MINMTAQPHLNQISAKGDPGPARSGGGKGLPLILGRKSLLMGMAASVGVALANAAQPSAMAGSVKPIAATQPTYVMKWAAYTAYSRGQQIVSPNNDVVSANAAHTSSAAFATDSAKWTISSTFLRQDSVFRLGTSENPVTDPAAARPTGIPVVYWITATAPTNAIDGDVISLPSVANNGLCYTADPRTLREPPDVWPSSMVNQTYYMRVIGGIVGATKYQIWVGTSSGNISIANFANSGSGASAVPTGTPRNPTGSVACPVTGVRTLTPSGGAFNVAEGDWIGMSCDNTTASFGGGAPWNPSGVMAGLSWAQTGHPARNPSGGWVGEKTYYVGVE